MGEPQNDTDRRLTEIRDEVRELKSLVDRLLVGDGQDGALGRITQLEQKHGFLITCYAWLAAGVLALLAMVLPGFFRNSN